MGTKKSQIAILITLLVIVFLILITTILYLLYLNIPRAPVDLNIDVQKIPGEMQIPSKSETMVNQFYPNMKFNHNTIIYKIDPNCNEKQKARMLKAFDIVSAKISLITFQENLEEPDIEVSCTENQEEDIKENHFIAGEGGAKEIIKTGRFNVITQGTIYLYNNLETKSIDCEYPNVEIHELMHVFGFDHSEDKNSLMFPLLNSCDQELDQSIIIQLNELYSKENLPDLYFQNVSATKKGRYLDFKLTIKNSGLVNTNNATLTILDDGEKIEEKDLGEIKFGAGISLETTNLKLARLNPKKIEFIIDKEDKIKEIDEGNNVAGVELG